MNEVIRILGGIITYDINYLCMPNSKTHDIITSGLTPIIGGISYYMLGVSFIDVVYLLGGFLFSSLMFNGDLDIKSKPYNRWWIFRFIWYPYRLIFPHRSLYTHGILIGSIIRLIWISPLILITFYLLNVDVIIFIKGDMVLFILVGIELGNINHTVLDYIS